MSTRTIIEIDHDYLRDLSNRPNDMEKLYVALMGSVISAAVNAGKVVEFPTGVRILAQRQHSETITLEVK